MKLDTQSSHSLSEIEERQYINHGRRLDLNFELFHDSDHGQGAPATGSALMVPLNANPGFSNFSTFANGPRGQLSNPYAANNGFEFCANNFGGLLLSNGSLRGPPPHNAFGQRLLFFPEQLVSVIPRLFICSTTMTHYDFVQRLYGDAFKHACNVKLDDAAFDALYNYD